MRRLAALALLVLVVGCTTDPTPVPVPLACVPDEPCIVKLSAPPLGGIVSSMSVRKEIPELGVVVVQPQPGDVSTLAADPMVVYTERDAAVALIEPVEVMEEVERVDQWHLDHIDVGDAWRYSHGEGRVVAIVDTGVDCTHPDLASACWQGATFVDARTCGPGVNCDGHGHGTHVAGIVAADGDATGVAPQASIRPVKVLNDRGNGSMSSVAQGIVWAAEQGVDVVNMSLGAPAPSRTVEEAVRYAQDRGVTIVAARGNAGSSGGLYPACYADISVTATDRDDERTGWSSYGNCGERLLVGAPGLGIVSTRTGGGHVSMSGTSMASPVTAGVVALLRAVGQDAIEGIRAGVVPIDNPRGEIGVVNAGRSVRPGPGPTPTTKPTVVPEPTTPYPPPPTPRPTPEPTEQPDCQLVDHQVLVFDEGIELRRVWVYEGCEE